MIHLRKLIPTLLAAVLTAAPAYAVETLGEYDDWTAHADGKGNGQVCWIYSEPQKDQGDYRQRGRIYALVTHRPGEDVTNQVQFTAGYTFKKGSVVEVQIGPKKFELFTNKDTAWARSKNDDDALVDAMRAGASMVVKGVSRRGTATTDTYSLSGVTAAHKAIGKACGVK